MWISAATKRKRSPHRERLELPRFNTEFHRHEIGCSRYQTLAWIFPVVLSCVSVHVHTYACDAVSVCAQAVAMLVSGAGEVEKCLCVEQHIIPLKKNLPKSFTPLTLWTSTFRADMLDIRTLWRGTSNDHLSVNQVYKWSSFCFSEQAFYLQFIV